MLRLKQLVSMWQGGSHRWPIVRLLRLLLFSLVLCVRIRTIRIQILSIRTRCHISGVKGREGPPLVTMMPVLMMPFLAQPVGQRAKKASAPVKAAEPRCSETNVDKRVRLLYLKDSVLLQHWLPVS